MSDAPTVRNCGDCGAKPGTLHVPGCDVERCALCGGQAISCGCIYAICGIDQSNMEETHPDIWHNGPTDEMYAKFDVEVEKYGGRLPWTGEWPGADACREIGIYSFWSETGGWVSCSKDHPRAGEDLNRLHCLASWDKVKRKWVARRPILAATELSAAPVGSVTHVEVLDQLQYVNDDGLPDGFRILVRSIDKKAVLMLGAKFSAAGIPFCTVDNVFIFPTLSGKNRWSVR